MKMMMKKKMHNFIVFTFSILASTLFLHLVVVLTDMFTSSQNSVHVADSDDCSSYSLQSNNIYGLIVLIVLLFAVSTPCLFLDSVVGVKDVSKSSPESTAVGDPDICSSNQKQKLNFDETLEVNTIKPTPRNFFPKLQPMIKRYLLDKISLNPLRFGRYLCGKFEKKMMNPLPDPDVVILSGKSDNVHRFDFEELTGAQAPPHSGHRHNLETVYNL